MSSRTTRPQGRLTPEAMATRFRDRKVEQVADLLYKADKLSDAADLTDLPQNLQDEYLAKARPMVYIRCTVPDAGQVH